MFDVLRGKNADQPDLQMMTSEVLVPLIGKKFRCPRDAIPCYRLKEVCSLLLKLSLIHIYLFERFDLVMIIIPLDR